MKQVETKYLFVITSEVSNQAAAPIIQQFVESGKTVHILTLGKNIKHRSNHER